MNYVTLPGTQITTTAIGFGCNDLLGNKNPQEGEHLLHVAYEAGIRHFDVARYYGYGDAEGLVGRFAQGKREQITITTKFGLQPMKQITRSKGLMQTARKLMRLSPAIRRFAQKKVSTFVEKGQFDVSSARTSLETSLRELKTDYIDIYLLHEPGLQDCESAELLEFLQQAQEAGKIRSFGIGTAYERAKIICEQCPDFSAVAQFESTLRDCNAQKIRREDVRLAHSVRAIITHGSYALLPSLVTRLQADASYRKQLSSQLGVDCTKPHHLAGLLLKQALQDNSAGIVLFRSSQPARITTNVSVAESIVLNQQQRDFFIGMIAALQPSL